MSKCPPLISIGFERVAKRRKEEETRISGPRVFILLVSGVEPNPQGKFGRIDCERMSSKPWDVARRCLRRKSCATPEMLFMIGFGVC